MESLVERTPQSLTPSKLSGKNQGKEHPHTNSVLEEKRRGTTWAQGPSSRPFCWLCLPVRTRLPARCRRGQSGFSANCPDPLLPLGLQISRAGVPAAPHAGDGDSEHKSVPVLAGQDIVPHKQPLFAVLSLLWLVRRDFQLSQMPGTSSSREPENRGGDVLMIHKGSFNSRKPWMGS